MSIFEKVLKIKTDYKLEINDDLLLRILFEMNRYFDKDFTNKIQVKQKKLNRVFNQKERNILRKYYYYKMDVVLKELEIDSFDSIVYNDDDINFILDEIVKRCETYGEEKIISSIKERKNNFESNNLVDNSEKWLEYYEEKRKRNFDYSVFILSINQEDFKHNNYNIDYYFDIISSMYDKLENYRHLIIKINGIIYDENNCDITWKIIYKLSIYCENFVQFTGKFFPFKQEKSINQLKLFLDERFSNNDNLSLASEFYKSISTGFKFEDCYVSDEQKNIIVTFKKIVLDNSPIPCPSCMTTIQSGNSFPEVFLRSYECKNPNCPDRSKSGRGKRFDEFGVYRYFKLVEDLDSNKIDYDIYDRWRRDIFSNDNNINEMISRYYAWAGETICLYGENSDDIMGRKFVNYNYSHCDKYLKKFDELPLVILMEKIVKLINRGNGKKVLSNNVEIYNGNSAVLLKDLAANQVGAAITSPPYYNAREYSQWPTLIMYLIDMMINGASVFDSLKNNGYYLYNIGDIVNTDNVYVESMMSKRRLQLGFLSCMFFEMVGFNLEGNIIWDKGQVQSKRNSTVNLNSGYVKCINCYEHVFVLKKGEIIPNNHVSYNIYFSPVIKINSKGENTYKHTAPYPPEMIELLKPFIDEDLYVLDPYLGSGTTVKWCLENGYKGLGYELNKEYFELCKDRIFSDNSIKSLGD